MSTSRAVKTLRRLKSLHPDDLGNLEFLLASEMSPLVTCHNHSYTVAMKKQMDIWYRHHVTTMRKLSRSQQSEFRNHIRVKNDMRRIYREDLIRRRQEEQFRLREEYEHDRAEAELKMMRLSLMGIGKTRNNPVHEERGGWLRLRNRRYAATDLTSPLMNSDKDSDDRSMKSCNIDSDDDVLSMEERDTRENHKLLPPKPTSSVSSETARTREQARSSFTTKGKVRVISSRKKSAKVSSRGDKTGRLKINSVAPNNREFDSKTQSECHANIVIKRTNYDHDNEHTGEHDRTTNLNQKKSPCTAITIHEGKTFRIKKSSIDNTEKGLLTSNPSKESKKKEDTADVTASDIATTLRTTKADKAQDISLKSKHYKAETSPRRIEINKKQQWGTAKCVLRLPEYKVNPVKRVIRYCRNDDGSLVGSVNSVKPASEKFILPTKKGEYLQRKALQWQIEHADVTEAKIEDFLNDGGPGIVSGLASRSGIVYSRYSSRSRGKELEPVISPSAGAIYAVYFGDVADVRNCRYLRSNSTIVSDKELHQQPVVVSTQHK